MRPCSMDLRQRVLADRDAGMSTAAVAAKFTVSTAWARPLRPHVPPLLCEAAAEARAAPWSMD